MIKAHLPNILTYFKHGISNAAAEGLNSIIQTVKSNARGYRSFDGFRSSILFYCGGLEMARELHTVLPRTISFSRIQKSATKEGFFQVYMQCP